MCRPTLVVMLLVAGSWGLMAPCSAAAQPKRSAADLIAELKKGDTEKLKAIEELAALGDKAADAVPPAQIGRAHV